MIHYHGTPVSGSQIDASRFLAGRHALIPFARQDALATALDVCQSIVLDNSAFSLWRAGGGDVDVHAYHAWVESLAGHPALDWCLIPDKIDGTEQDNIELLNTWLRIGCSVEGVPVFHMHETDDWLDHLCSRFRTVAIGSSGQWSSPGTASWWQRMAQIMRVACDEKGRPRCRLHGLRMLDPDIFRRLPMVSADSTNASVNAGSISRFGMYPAPTSAQRADTIAARIESHQSCAVWMGSTEQLGMFA